MQKQKGQKPKSKESKIRWDPILIEPPKNPLPALSTLGMKPIHEDLPQIPICAAINGPRNRGKSVLCFNLVSKKPGMYGDAFKPNNLFVWSPTAHLDKTYDELKLQNHLGPEQISVQDLMVQMFSAQRKHLANDNLTGVFVLFDDITEERKAWEHIETLGYKGRHWHIHMMFVAHKLSAVPRGVRTATQQWIIFQPHEQSEMEWIIESFSRKETKPIWTMACLRAWSIDFNFVFIDFSQKEFQRIYRSGFSDPLFTWEEQQFLDIQCLMNSPFEDPNHMEPKDWMKQWKRNQTSSKRKDLKKEKSVSPKRSKPCSPEE